MASNSVSESKNVTNLIELGNKLAVLVGINEYADSSINRLNFSVKDIQDFHSILIDPEKGKYENNNIKVLSDANAEKPTRNNIFSKLTTLTRSANPEDSILFYFSGHGAEIDGKPYLLCSDSFRNTIEQTALPNELIRKTMEGSLARVKIIIIDACHSGVLKGIKESGTMTKSFFDSFFPPPEGFVTLSSCKLGEVSHEWAEKEHGVFSYYLLEGLNGSADMDGDGIITITDAHRYSSESVKRWAFQKGLEQNPTLFATISGDIPFIHVGKKPGKAELIDKSVIFQTNLLTTPVKDREETMENMCGSLLQFFKAGQIEKKSMGYKFPYGEIQPRFGISEGEGKWWIEVSIKYTKEYWGEIDEVIKCFDKRYYWNSIEFILSKRMNVDEIVRKCKESAFEVVSFKPEKGQEKIIVDTKAWLDTRTIFQNLEHGSFIKVSSKAIDKAFPDNFYSTLSPENMMEFIKNSLE
jgi:hypothetical protein